jgi:hypothetical protein
MQFIYVSMPLESISKFVYFYIINYSGVLIPQILSRIPAYLISYFIDFLHFYWLVGIKLAGYIMQFWLVVPKNAIFSNIVTMGTMCSVMSLSYGGILYCGVFFSFK